MISLRNALEAAGYDGRGLIINVHAGGAQTLTVRPAPGETAASFGRYKRGIARLAGAKGYLVTPTLRGELLISTKGK